MSSDQIQLQIFPDRQLLRRVDQEKNLHFFYLMTVQRDLFGGAVLQQEWGPIGRPGRVVKHHFADEGQAVDALADLVQAKRKHGYV
jgi:predicted DNA-binding WGR domain protein